MVDKIFLEELFAVGGLESPKQNTSVLLYSGLESAKPSTVSYHMLSKLAGIAQCSEKVGDQRRQESYPTLIETQLEAHQTEWNWT